LRDRDELSRADLLALDFSAPRERVLSQVLSISIEGLTVDDAHALTLGRHSGSLALQAPRNDYRESADA